MNRRSFLAGVLALPAALKAACANPDFFVQTIRAKKWTVEFQPAKHFVVHNFAGSQNDCSLTHASIQPLTPDDLNKLADSEKGIFMEKYRHLPNRCISPQYTAALEKIFAEHGSLGKYLEGFKK